MLVKNLFSKEECDFLIQALMLYSKDAIPLTSFEKHKQLISTSIEKIQSLTTLTNFSNEEINIIFLAVDFFEANVDEVPTCCYKLLHKLKSNYKFL